MKNCAGKRSEGALRPQNHVFLAHFSIFWPYRAKIRRKTKNLNKGLLGTTHKLSLGTPLRTLLDYRVQPVGRPQSPDVEPKTIERLREIATAAATTIKIHLAGAYESPVTAKT